MTRRGTRDTLGRALVSSSRVGDTTPVEAPGCKGLWLGILAYRPPTRRWLQNHVQNILTKLQLRKPYELMRDAIQKGLDRTPD